MIEHIRKKKKSGTGYLFSDRMEKKSAADKKRERSHKKNKNRG